MLTGQQDGMATQTASDKDPNVSELYSLCRNICCQTAMKKNRCFHSQACLLNTCVACYCYSRSSHLCPRRCYHLRACITLQQSSQYAVGQRENRDSVQLSQHYSSADIVIVCLAHLQSAGLHFPTNLTQTSGPGSDRHIWG